MAALRYVLASSLVILGACGAVKRADDRTSDSGSDAGAGGRAGTAGTGGSGGSGGRPAACTPTDRSCYPSGAPGGPGSECLAQRDNSGEGRVQTASVWTGTLVRTAGGSSTVYDILRTRSAIDWPACGSPNGTGGLIRLFDWDRSNPDPLTHTVRFGHATYHKSPAPGPPPSDLVRDGLCMAEFERSGADDPFGELALPAGIGLSYPWRIRPVVSKRVTADFTVSELFPDRIPEGEGRVFIDEASGYVHGYMPLAWFTLLDSRTSGFGLPIRHFEIKTQFNDGTFNCAGRHRAESLELNRNCDSADQKNPPWGCEDDTRCPPAGFDNVGVTGPGAGATFMKGFHMIVDLERVFSVSLGASLCVTYAGIPMADGVAQGWAAQTPEGYNCRGGSKWNPSLPNDDGLPMGDWCSRTNSPATPTCHDAYRSHYYSVERAFKIKDDTCSLGTL
jgi:hypothetical protein